jgi:hypothetical protein
MGKIQIIKCRCGKIFAACVESECYTDKDWTKELRKYVNGGCTVEMIDSKEFIGFEKCDCNKQKKLYMNLNYLMNDKNNHKTDPPGIQKVEVWRAIGVNTYPRSSIQRAITTLTDRGYLVKLDGKEGRPFVQRPGEFGAKTYAWVWNKDK